MARILCRIATRPGNVARYSAANGVFYFDAFYFNPTLRHIKLFPQCDEHLFFSIPGVRNH